MNIRLTSGFFLLIGLISSQLQVAAATEWIDVSPGLPEQLRTVAFGNNLFVTGGQGGKYLFSSDGQNWSDGTSPTNLTVNGMAFGLNQFVAVGTNGLIANSDDGQIWKLVSGPVITNLNSVLFDGTQFVAVGDGGILLGSVDGQSWQTNVISGANGFAAIASGVLEGTPKYITAGGGSIYSADDYKNLLFRTNLVAALNGVIVGGAEAVVVGNSGKTAYSSDGKDWQPVDVSPTVNLNGVFFDGGLFYALGGNGTIITSPDGQAWQADQSNTAVELRAGIHNAGKLIAVGDAGTILLKYLDTDSPTLSVTNFTDLQSISNSPVTIGGTASDAGHGGNGVAVFLNGAFGVLGNADGSGVANWHITAPVVNGTNTFRFVAQDNAANSTTNVLRLIMTQIPPVATAASGLTTNGFTANWNAVNGAMGYRLDVSTDINFNSYVIGYQDLDVGNLLTRLVVGLNANTAYYYRVRAYDSGGTSGNSSTINVTTASVPETTPPLLAILAPSDFQVFTNAGITISGTADDVSGVASVTVNGSNATIVVTNWSSAVNLSGGTNTFTVIATDGSANANKTTQTVHAVFSPPAPPDTTPPALAINAPTNLQVFTNAGIIVSGTTSDSSGVAGITVNGLAASVVGTNWSRAFTLSTGTNTLTVIATDNSPSVNTTTQIVQAVFSPPLVDTTPPSLTLIAPTNLQIFTNAGITVSGTANDSSGIAGVTVNGQAASVVGTNWSRAFTLSTGTNTLTVIATDSSPSVNTTTQIVQAVLSPSPADTTPPVLTIIFPTNLQVFTNAGIIISGTANDSSGIAGVVVNGQAASVVGTNWSRAFTLSTGTNTLSVIATDSSIGLNTTTQIVQAVFSPPPTDTAVPTLVVLSPTDFQVFTNAGISVSGITSDNTGIGSVTVNGLAATLAGTNWTRAFTLLSGTNTLTVIATDSSANLNTATQTVHAVLNLPVILTNHPPQIVAGPTVTNALLQVDAVAVVLAGATNVFTVTATDADSDPLNYLWDFGDGSTSGAPSAQSLATHSYSITNCGPYHASVVVSDSTTNTTGGLTVTVPCELDSATLSLKANFKKANADSVRLTALVNLPGGFDPTGMKITLNVAGATIPFDGLDVKGKTANQFGKCQLAFKNGVWTITAKLKRGDWQDAWATHEITNENVPKPGRDVTVSAIIVVGEQAFMSEVVLTYTATAGKSGTAK